MRRLRTSIIAISLILATTTLLATATVPAYAGARSHGSYRHQMFTATNRSRSAHHRGHLSLNKRMSALAERHSAEMAKRGYLFHTSNVSTYLRGVSWHAWGENVGYMRGGDVHILQKAFMHSPVHRENILNGAFRHVAVGTVYSNGRLWVTVFFYG
ncbi:MAG: hypothetical protein QOE25_887 [Actinomycetota bacterium]|nr:hypothetical protein [Actinomycetota bacterium]